MMYTAYWLSFLLVCVTLVLPYCARELVTARELRTRIAHENWERQTNIKIIHQYPHVYI